MRSRPRDAARKSKLYQPTVLLLALSFALCPRVSHACPTTNHGKTAEVPAAHDSTAKHPADHSYLDSTSREPGPMDIPRRDMGLLRCDCDGNGICDSVDIRMGAATDTNHNGVDDWCDPDSAVQAAAQDTAVWAQRSLQQGGLSVWTRYSPSDHIRILVVVPTTSSPLSITLVDQKGKLVATVYHGVPKQRALSFHWALIASSGRPIPRGVYRLRVIQAGSHVSRIVEWDEY